MERRYRTSSVQLSRTRTFEFGYMCDKNIIELIVLLYNLLCDNNMLSTDIKESLHIHPSIHFLPLAPPEDPKAFPGQPSDIVTPVCPGTSSGSPPGGAYQEHLPWKRPGGI